MLEKELEEVGLRPNEAKIYSALLRIGTATPAQVARETGLSRSYVYDALETLKAKGLVGMQMKNGKRHYTASDPKHLEEAAKEQLAKAQKIVPVLAKAMEASIAPSEVSVYEGAYIYKQLLRDITGTMKAEEEVLIFGIDDERIMRLDEYYPHYLDYYFAFLKEAGVKERAIVRMGARKLKEAKTTRYRFLDGKYFGDVAFEVYKDRLALFEWGGQSRLVLIRNARIADAYRRQFEFFWKNAKE
ncbi:MAG: helix-turn-helix domain-containing protein [Candidatus Micrarchaeota archaeon]